MYHREFKACAQRLRPKLGEQDLVMWVDEICTKQADITKRNGQTANTRAIYQHAASVAVFLGMESSRSAGAMRSARDLDKSASREELKKLVEDPGRKERIEGLVTLFTTQY
ncbi:uncharacterized protein RSE6_09154 [Rhynchosporium secalis]|uniref:Heterokaryon incompatibility domain-containing protein n=1 Tax=Rhynchosporium secalis TaxID=38038 RepID=A0A1E1MH85_RHYSE|nr:uncharacterized protein RSE6_09154 [Rhynchosporium secalis]